MYRIGKNKVISCITAGSIIIISLLINACTEIHNEGTAPVSRETYVYNPEVIDLFYEGYYTNVYNVLEYDDCLYAVTQRIPEDLSEAQNYLCCINSDGYISSEMFLNPAINIYVSSYIMDGIFVYVTFSGRVEKMNIETGDIIYSSSCGNNLCGVAACDDGYVVLSAGRIDKYDASDNLVASIENDEWQFYNGYRTFYQSGGKCYLIADTGFHGKYYEIDFANSASRLVYDPMQSDKILLNCSGKYIFDEEGEYRLDFDNSTLYTLTRWSDMNLMPPKYDSVMTEYVGINDEIFLQILNYDNGWTQLVVYSYDGTQNYSDRIPVMIGGFNCKYDLALNWAIYEYNTSQSEYRAVIEDYNEDFGWESAEEAASQRAALISYFNSGNAPDIFYGNQIDYIALADSGSLLDISGFMTEEFFDNFNKITPNIRDLMIDEDGNCYRIFSGYQIDGFSSAYDIGQNVSIDGAVTIANENSIMLYPNEISLNLAKYAIRNAIYDESLDAGDLEQILDYAYAYGFQDLSASIPVDMNRLTVNDYLLWETNIYSVLRLDEIYTCCGEQLVFVGYPSVSGSTHSIIPFGQVAISSATAHPEECVNVISNLLDERTQYMNNFSCIIPVNDICMRKMVEYAGNHSIIPEDDFEYALYLDMYDEISDTSAAAFYSYIDSIDTTVYDDWGLISIIYDEVESHWTQGKSVEMIAQSLYSRLNLYLEEN